MSWDTDGVPLAAQPPRMVTVAAMMHATKGSGYCRKAIRNLDHTLPIPQERQGRRFLSVVHDSP